MVSDILAVLEMELKQLIVDSLRLEDIRPADIVSEDPLFYDGLGLDSLDALELGVAISKRYGIQMANDPAENREVFSSVRAMATFVAKRKS